MKRLLKPGPFITALLLLLSGAGLIAVFARGLENSFLAYAVYPLSAYTLTVAVFQAPELWRRGSRFLRENTYYNKYKNDLYIRERLSFLITLAFCIYKGVAAGIYRSMWMASVAVYYLLLALLKQKKRSPRACGFLLLALTAALGGVACATIITGSAPRYPGHMIYAAAAYAFYSLGMAVYKLVRGRGGISLAAALVSIYFLQTAMIAQFGEGLRFQHSMNALTGAAVFLAIAALALRMITARE